MTVISFFSLSQLSKPYDRHLASSLPSPWFTQDSPWCTPSSHLDSQRMGKPTVPPGPIWPARTQAGTESEGTCFPASRALVISEQPETLIQVQTPGCGLRMDRSKV